METRYNFCILIISNGRPNDIKTINTLNSCGNTYPWYIVLDNLDKSEPEYRKKYGAKVIIFDKPEIAKKVDNGDNFNNLRTTTHARNACFDIAKDLGYDYFLVLDDDYTSFDFRINHLMDYPSKFWKIRNIDKVFNSYIEFFIKSKAKTLCMTQGGDYIGGPSNPIAIKKTLLRKAMNSFFCSTKNRFNFVSRLNEDVNTYLSLGAKGELFLTAPLCSLTQKQTQGTAGGMTDAYIDGGTYIKSFYSVMYCPSFVKVTMMATKFKRIHYIVNWKHATPLIISEKHKKK